MNFSLVVEVLTPTKEPHAFSHTLKSSSNKIHKNSYQRVNDLKRSDQNSSSPFSSSRKLLARSAF